MTPQVNALPEDDNNNEAGDESKGNHKKDRKLIIRARNFLLFCSGACVPILTAHGGDWEINKYLTIGAIVFLTAIFASLSGGYAIHLIFRNQVISSFLGLLWGITIFVLDRLMLLAIKPRENTSEGTAISKFKNLVLDSIRLLPRLLLAFFIGLIVAKPLEVRLFQKQIINQYIDDRLESFESPESPLKKLENKTNDAKKNYDGNLIRDPGAKESFTQKRRGEYNSLKTELDNEERRRKDLESDKRGIVEGGNEEEIGKILRKYEGLNFFQQLELLDKISNLQFYVWFITSLFILIEILPIFSKLMFPFGDYDKVLENQSSIVIAASNARLAHDKKRILIKFERKEKRSNDDFLKEEKARAVEAREAEHHQKTKEIELEKQLSQSEATAASENKQQELEFKRVQETALAKLAMEKMEQDAASKEKEQDIKHQQEIQAIKHKRQQDNMKVSADSDRANRDQLLAFTNREVEALLRDLKETDNYRDARSRVMREVAKQVELKLFGLSQALSDQTARSAVDLAQQAATNQIQSRFEELETWVEEIAHYLEELRNSPKGSTSVADSGIDEPSPQDSPISESDRDSAAAFSDDEVLQGETSSGQRDLYGPLSSSEDNRGNGSTSNAG